MYKFHGSRRPTINRYWIEAPAVVANTSTGLCIVPEPARVSEMDEKGMTLPI